MAPLYLGARDISGPGAGKRAPMNCLLEAAASLWLTLAIRTGARQSGWSYFAAGLAAAAALPRLTHACGLGTGGLFVTDVVDLQPENGSLPVSDVVPDPARLAALAAPADRRDWWISRVRECHALLPSRP
jgi:O-succinylbenzoate synthase